MYIYYVYKYTYIHVKIQEKHVIFLINIKYIYIRAVKNVLILLFLIQLNFINAAFFCLIRGPTIVGEMKMHSVVSLFSNFADSISNFRAKQQIFRSFPKLV